MLGVALAFFQVEKHEMLLLYIAGTPIFAGKPTFVSLFLLILRKEAVDKKL